MNEFCRKFFQEEVHDVEKCPQCRETWAEIKREDAIIGEVGGPLYHRTTLERAALNCHGQP